MGLLALEQLKHRLFEEGLFALERKRSLPAAPRIIGVVTSAHGAAWHDIRVVSMRRGPVKLVLAPAVVQGEGAPLSIISALDLVEQYPGLDAVIIGRGGGSLEDLMAFNDERVVRRVGACRVPSVSAVGHEIDVSLCDLVADARAATPSEAAERLVSDSTVSRRELSALHRRLLRAIRERLREDRAVLQNCRAKLADPRYLLAEKQQTVDDLGFRLERRMGQVISGASFRLGAVDKRLHDRHPRLGVQRARALVMPLELRLRHATRARFERHRRSLEGQHARLCDLSPLTVLARGYAIALDEAGRAVTDVATLRPGDRLELRVHRGRTQVSVLTELSSARRTETPS
jgi:exodeoxyribonuclease VII large subunit